MRILIVDDHREFRQLLSQLLHLHLQPEEVHEADSAASTRQLLRLQQQPFELILLDHWLPDGDGLALLQQIISPHPDSKVVMLSGCEDPELMCNSLNIGAKGYIPKTTEPAVMTRAIKLVLAGETYIPSHLLPHLNPQGARQSGTHKRGMTGRQLEVYKLMRTGISNKEIARCLNISEATVKAHVTAILRANGVTSRTQLIDRK